MFPWLPTMTEITAIGGANFFKQKCLDFHPGSSLEAFATDCTNYFGGVKAGFVWGCGEVGTSRDGHHHTVKLSPPHTLTASQLHSFASAWPSCRWPVVGICNRFDETAKRGFTLRQGRRGTNVMTSIGTLLAGALASSAPSSRWIPWSCGNQWGQRLYLPT